MTGRTGRGRVVFVNRFFYPDESATSQILTDLAVHLASEGWDIQIVTSRLSYSDPAVRHPARANWQGVDIRRVWTSGFGRGALIGRAIDYVSFYLSSFFAVLAAARRGDVVVAKTDPPLLGLTIGLAARLKGARFANWLQDVFPEVASESGLRVPLFGLLRFLRNRNFRSADLNVAIGTKMEAFIAGETGGQARTAVIGNFVDDVALQPNPEGAGRLRQEWGFADDDFVVGYSGNLGRAHDVETMLGAAQLLKDNQKIQFLFVGGGHLRAFVEAETKARGLTNIHFKPYQPRAFLSDSLSLPDVQWVSLIPAMEGLIVPSKLYGIAAAGRPVLNVGDAHGEIAGLLNAHGFGETFAPGESARLATAITALSTDPDRLAAMGRAALTFADHDGARATAFSKWEQCLRTLSEGRQTKV